MEDYASPETRAAGMELIEEDLSKLPNREAVAEMIRAVREDGVRDACL
jgi:hypothetical protein